ncbi:NADAR family protein [Pseudomonas sp. NMI760_13]|nr:NADAR family protein [Pseudomonas sp. NMI760_13]
MSPGFPILVNDLIIPTSEALYQACRFPNNPEAQQLIISQTSPMTAKMRSKPLRHLTRPDWMMVRVRIMRWCLRAKLLSNMSRFSELILSTENKSIVEHSTRDSFWGAIQDKNGILCGANVLGRLLMELRQDIINNADPYDFLEPPAIENFLILNKPINIIYPRKDIDLFTGM